MPNYSEMLFNEQIPKLEPHYFLKKQYYNYNIVFCLSGVEPIPVQLDSAHIQQDVSYVIMLFNQ